MGKGSGSTIWTKGQNNLIEDILAANEDLRDSEVVKLALDALIEKYDEKAHFKKELINPRINAARKHNGSISQWMESRRIGGKPGTETEHFLKDYKIMVTAHFDVCLCEPKQSTAARDAQLSEYKCPGALVSSIYPQHGVPKTKLSKKNLKDLVKVGFPNNYAEMKRRADHDEDLVQLGGTARRGSGKSRSGKGSKASKVKDTVGVDLVKDEEEEGMVEKKGDNKRKRGGSGSGGDRKSVKKEESEDEEWKVGKGKGKMVEREKRRKVKEEPE